MDKELNVPQWEREKDDPDAGHTFRLTSVSRGSYSVVGDPTHHDADWMLDDEPFIIEVRAWSLSAACEKAAGLPLHCWTLKIREV